MNKFAVALLVLLACVAVFAIEKPLKNEEADLSDSSLSFEDSESQYEAQVKLGQPPVKPKPQPKGKPAKSKGVPVKPTGKVAPVTKSTKTVVGPVKPIKPTKTVPAVPTTKATKTKVAPVTKTSKTATVTKTVTKSTKTAPVTKSTKTAPTTKPTKAAPTTKPTKAAPTTKSTKTAPVTKSTKTAPTTKSTKTAPTTKSTKTGPAKKAPPKKKKKGPPKKKTKTTTDPCTTTATGKGKGKGKGMSTGTTNTTATNTKVTKFAKGKGKSTGTTTDPCAPAPPACNNTVCGSTCCEFSDQVCCNDQCVTNGTFCCPSGQIASNYPPDATLTTCTNQTMCCPIGQVNCAGTCTLESQCCGYNIVCNPQPISGNTQCCRTGPNSVSTGDYCCPDPANVGYNLTCVAPCCGASRTCCPLSNNQQCTNTASGICCPNAGDYYNATAGTCCSSPFCATSAGQLCCQSQAVSGTSCVAPTNSPAGTLSRCCAPSFTTCGSTCCPSSGTCNNGVCCTADVTDNYVPIAVYNGTTAGTPSTPAASATNEVLISGFVPATRDPFNYACISLDDYQTSSCASPTPSGPSVINNLPACARDIDPPATNPDFSQANHVNSPTSSRSSLSAATLTCSLPDFLTTPSPAQPFTIWQSDITRGVNRLTTTTRIPVPKVFNFAISMVYSRVAVGNNACLNGGETNSPVAGSDCAHWPFNLGGVALGCNTGALSNNNYLHPVARFYLHFEDINGVRQNDLVYDIIPGQDGTETTQASSATLQSKDMPTTASGPFRFIVWGGNGLGKIPRNLYVQGVQLPTTYRSYVLTGYDLVDTTNGDPMCGGADAISSTQCGLMPAIVANQGVTCNPADNSRRPKVQTSLWATSVKTACVLYGGTAVQPDRGYPA